MKVILNNDVPNLGELGDVKDVARGFARNYLLPRGLAFPFTKKAVELFEKRKDEIAKRKEEKRLAAAGLKARLEAEEIAISMPAGHNGKLYGAVTNQTVVDELLKRGIEVDRKKVEVPGRAIKSVGNYKVAVHLYEKEEAVVRVSVKGTSAKDEHAARNEPKHERKHEVKTEAVAEVAAEPAAEESAQTEE